MNNKLSEDCYDLIFTKDRITYEEKINSADTLNIKKAVCTVNWKDIADNYGLKAADEAILAVSLALYKCNLGREIYHTRYAEFVVLELSVDFEKRTEDFYDIIRKWHGISAPCVRAEISVFN